VLHRDEILRRVGQDAIAATVKSREPRKKREKTRSLQGIGVSSTMPLVPCARANDRSCDTLDGGTNPEKTREKGRFYPIFLFH
jgi:hypothetical protein